MTELPQGWVEAYLHECVIAKKGKKPSSFSDSKKIGYIPYLDIQAIERNNIRQYVDHESSCKSEGNDILVVWDGARCGLACKGQRGAIGSTIMGLTPFAMDNCFLFYFIRSQYDYINSNPRGTGIPHVDPGIFWNIEVPIPPLPEQHRLVVKLEKLLARVDSCREQLDRVPVLLKRFRQSVLAAACSGRLTEDWREKQPPWQETLLSNITLTMRTGPFGSALHKSDYITDGLPVINPMNLLSGNISPSKNMTVDQFTAKRLHDYKIKSGDIIIARRGEMGRCALVTPVEEGYICGTGSMILRLAPCCYPPYIQLVISSPSVREYLLDVSVGSTMDNLNQKAFSSMPISLPGIDEQQEIVRRVTTLFTFADQVEARYLQAKAHIDRLTQSILAKAFRGELVPQDPNDEPAEELLRRIRVTRQIDIGKSRKRKGVKL